MTVFAEEKRGYHNPYEEVDWSQWEFVHSMSHQHQGLTNASREIFLAMGYRHFAFSNYYPSKPTYPLPESWTSKHPEIIAAPNAEQHSYTDAGLHANSLGSMFTSGYGKPVPKTIWKTSPIEFSVDDMVRYTEERPWDGIYRLDVRFTSESPDAEVKLTIEGVEGSNVRKEYESTGPITNQVLKPGNHSVAFRVLSDVVTAKVVFDPSQVTITDLRFMQGTYRPWRRVFDEILDGYELNGKKEGGLLFPDGGGITLNHPTGKQEIYESMLDHDPRVLGIEVWNHLASGFGSSKGGYVIPKEGEVPDHHFYELWDQLLSSGRRCWGFFVKDHTTYGRGRNILLTPPLADLSNTEKEAAALRAYRQGAFFGSVATFQLNEEGEVAAPFDHSTFRFRRIAVRRNASGEAEAVAVEIGDQDQEKRPHLQIRFVTEKGSVSIVDGDKAEFSLSDKPLYVRVEAIAYPDTERGEKLTAEKIRGMHVAEIARIHDQIMEKDKDGVTRKTFNGNPLETAVPIPTAEMLFSQPIRRV